jgi:hypothetical protein
MQRTGYLPAVHDALRQRAALVRAFVAQGEQLVVDGAEDGDVARGGVEDARALTRDVVKIRDFDPIAHVQVPLSVQAAT